MEPCAAFTVTQSSCAHVNAVFIVRSLHASARSGGLSADEVAGLQLGSSLATPRNFYLFAGCEDGTDIASTIPPNECFHSCTHVLSFGHLSGTYRICNHGGDPYDLYCENGADIC